MATRVVLALCLACRTQWQQEAKRNRKLDWLKCPKCG